VLKSSVLSRRRNEATDIGHRGVTPAESYQFTMSCDSENARTAADSFFCVAETVGRRGDRVQLIVDTGGWS